MHRSSRIAALIGALLAIWTSIAEAKPSTGPQLSTAPQLSTGRLEVRAVAEVESKSVVAGREVTKLVPANRLVPGDRVIYTLEVRNAGPAALESPSVTHAVPAHMQYVMDSAVGPGAAVSYSVDGGHRFERPEYLRVLQPDGHWRSAGAADYTHIRWELKNTLKPNSIAFVRFRALVR